MNRQAVEPGGSGTVVWRSSVARPRAAAFQLKAELEGEVVRISVRDFGRWRRPRGEHRGRGTKLREASMDLVEREVTARETIVRMERALAREVDA